MNVAVVGAGAWGTAFSIQLASKGHRVTMWVYEPDLCETMKETGENTLYLPGFVLPRGMEFTNDPCEAVDAADTVVLAMPSFALRPTLARIAQRLTTKKVLVLTKGLETETLFPMCRVVEEETGKPAGLAVLSGPSFAKEVARRLFTSAVVASADKGLSRYFQEMIHDERFRVYTSQDVVGVELGGALKNVMAIGAGIIEGLDLGYNTLAAYMTRALAEIKRLGNALGARETTFMGLSGMGDLILTCTGPLSRNRQFGVELTKGKDPEEVIRSQKTVVEGFYTIRAAYRLSTSLDIEMPITEELYRVVYEHKDIRTSFDDICRRAIKEEDG
jgi:glycerol-3-phosphate dehydrogenase (NAD(P)+)